MTTRSEFSPLSLHRTFRGEFLDLSRHACRKLLVRRAAVYHSPQAASLQDDTPESARNERKCTKNERERLINVLA